MRSQHIPQYKIISTIISSISPYLGWRPTNAIKSASFSTSHRARRVKKMLLYPLFSCSVPVFTSSVLPPSAHTPCPHISLDLNVNMNEKTWRASDSLFPASDSDHALISTDLVLFSCGGVERDKVDHTGRSDTGDEAMMGKSRR